ncbi:MAG TPA: flippase activity-associated protein Agl23 [Candidatus Limnocylindrales bacterium]
MKSRSRRRGRLAGTDRPGAPGPIAPAADETGPATTTPPPGPAHTGDRLLDWADRFFIPAALVILLVAAAIRLPELALNPFHHDEGVNGFFTTNLVRDGTYTYDPANYHGPTLYYFALVSEILFGLTTEAMRLVPALFGILLVALVFPLRRYLGPVVTLTAAALLALSPAEVYVSRYFIHEMLVASLSLALVVAAIFYLDRREPRFLLAGAVAAALLFATKETGIITVAVLLIAVVIAHVYVGLRHPQPRQGRRERPVPRRQSVWIDGVEYRAATDSRPGGGNTPIWQSGIPTEHVAGAAVIFLVIYVLLYSSFFTNFPKGLTDSLATFTIWAQHGESTQVQPFTRYLEWMIPLDLPILLLGVAGGLIVAIRARDRLSVTIGLWAAGITTAYSLIQYKTPWIVVNMLIPLALLAGLAIAELWRSRLRVAAPVLVVVALAVSGYQAVDLNFNRYDDQTEAYVYVHSTRDMLSLIDEIEATAARAGTGKETGIVFVTPDYWPLPWYFRDYPRAGFFGQIVDTQEAMIVANVTQEAELAPKLAGRYDLVRQYNLRPGVDLALYVRTDIPKA